VRCRADSNRSSRYGSSVKRKQCGQVTCHVASRAWRVARRAQRGHDACVDTEGGIVAETAHRLVKDFADSALLLALEDDSDIARN
jgi:hypothetical protein